jgi:hypothetical protein
MKIEREKEREREEKGSNASEKEESGGITDVHKCIHTIGILQSKGF